MPASQKRGAVALPPSGIRILFLLIACLLRPAPVRPVGPLLQADIEKASRGTPQPQGEHFQIKVNVDLVTTDVTVVGANFAKLQADDFTVYDNKVSQPIAYFSRDQLPLAIAVLVDGSESIRPYLPILQFSALSALRRLKPEDQIALFSFAGNTSRLSDLTTNRFSIAEKIGKLRIGMGTNVFGTIHDAVRYLSKKAPGRRRAIVLVSDNCHNAFGTLSSEQCLIELLESATTLYNIWIPGENSPNGGGCTQWNFEVRRLAEQTGGQVWDALEPASIQDALEQAITSLRMQYTLGFNPSDPGPEKSFHKLAVRLANPDRCPGCLVLARAGYYAGVRPPPPPKDETPAPPPLSPEKMERFLTQQIIMSAGTIDMDLRGIPFEVLTAEQKGPDGMPQIRVDLLIHFDGIQFRTVEDRHNCNLRVTVFYADARGAILGSDWRSIQGSLTDENYHRVLKQGLFFSTAVPLKTKKQILNIVVYDEEGGNVGSRLIRLP